MSKEELEKEAEELIQRFEMANSMNCYMQLTPDRKQIGEMLVMIAEPREKRIVELEKENAELKEQHYADCKLVDKTSEIIGQLTKAKEQLTKAGELLTFWVNDFYDGFNNSIRYEERHKAIIESEQFLKENKNDKT